MKVKENIIVLLDTRLCPLEEQELWKKLDGEVSFNSLSASKRGVYIFMKQSCPIKVEEVKNLIYVLPLFYVLYS